MEEEFVKNGVFAPLTPGKQNLESSSVLINGRKQVSFHGESETSGVQLFVDLGDLIYVNDGTKFDSETTKVSSDTISINIPFPAMLNDVTKSDSEATKVSSSKSDTVSIPLPAIQHDDASHQASAQTNGAGLASSTPEKQQDSKKRLNSGTDINKKSPPKPKKHRPKILDESFKRKTAKAQVSGFQPKTPLKRSTPKPCAKKNHVKKSSKLVFDSSGYVVQELEPKRSCKQALNSNFDKEAEVENVCNTSKDGDDQFLNLNLNRKKEKRFAKQYHRRRKKRMDNNGLNMVKPSTCATAEIVTPASNVTDADPQSSQETAHSSQLVCDMDHLPSVACSYDSNLSPKIRRGTRDCVTSLLSSPVVWRRKRSTGCTKRRIYASQPVKFKCSRSSLVNLLEHLTEKNHHPNVRLANRKKDMKRGHGKIKPSPENPMIKMIKNHLPQECLLIQKDPNEHNSVDLMVAKFKSLSIHQKYGQLVVGHQNVDAPIVVYQGKFDPRKNNKKAQAEVDLDQESERAWTMLMATGESTYDEQDSDKEYWDRERQVTIDRVESVVSILREFQGNRRFSKWKGSVLDSIIGAYLTQNVSDHLSSSAFMSIVARFPIRKLEGSDRSRESAGTFPLLDLFPQKDDGVERFGNSTTFHEIENCASTSENESSITSTSMANNQASITQSTIPLKGAPVEQKTKDKNKKEQSKDWDILRRTYCTKRERNEENMDAVDWQAVRQARVDDVADTIVKRGMNNVLGKKIKDFLNRTVRIHGTLNLEWLRDVPPKDAKEYLLDIYGIGLKSVECIRLLTLYHVAFPVDVNVGRVAIRLGWVPLQPLPGGLQMHHLKEYPLIDNVQKYLYPRLCTLNHETLYELHYHLITFGKVFCTKLNPRCEGCPLKAQCKHYASLSTSTKFSLPAPTTNSKRNAKKSGGRTTNINSNMEAEPVVEMPNSPEHHMKEFELEDIEDLCMDHNVALVDLNDYPESDDDIPIIRLDDEAYDNQNEVENLIQEENTLQALAVPSIPSSTPIPNYRGRLKSVHQVYVLPDSHPLLEKLRVDKRDPDDPSPYLFAPWTIHEEGLFVDRVPSSTPGSSFPQDCGSLEVCRDIVCCSSLSKNEEHGFATTISGTLMIPVRTANNGRFALNGTYFQVNEVFADEESTKVPIIVPTYWLYGLQRSILYCGASVSSTFKDIPMEHMHYAFSQGFYCSRGFNRKTRYTTDLDSQFHIKTSKQGKKTRGKNLEGEGR